MFVKMKDELLLVVKQEIEGILTAKISEKKYFTRFLKVIFTAKIAL